MRQEVELQVGKLQSGDIHEGLDAAQALLALLKGSDGGSGVAAPAAVVALGALPALQSLAAQLPRGEPVEQLLHLCCVAKEVMGPAPPDRRMLHYEWDRLGLHRFQCQNEQA